MPYVSRTWQVPSPRRGTTKITRPSVGKLASRRVAGAADYFLYAKTDSVLLIVVWHLARTRDNEIARCPFNLNQWGPAQASAREPCRWLLIPYLACGFRAGEDNKRADGHASSGRSFRESGKLL